MLTYCDKDGNQITRKEAGRLMEDREYSTVGHILLRTGYTVLTVWVGIPLSHPFTKLVSYFETLVSGPDDQERQTERYATLKEAHRGHDRMVTKWGNPNIDAIDRLGGT